MNKKGFMFSIEMLGVMSIIIVVITTMAVFSTEEINDTKIFEIKNADKAMMAVYQISPESFTGLAEDNVICRETAEYDIDINKIIEKRQCGWD